MSLPRAPRRSLGSGRAAAKSARRSSLAVACLAGFTFSCQPKPAGSSSPAPADSARPPAAPLPKPEAPQGPSLEFAVGSLRTFRFVRGLVDLEDGTHFSRPDFERAVLRAKDPRASAAIATDSLAMLLDDQTPRPLLLATVPLESLVDEDRELAPGWHALTVVLASEESVEVEVVRFQLELEGTVEGFQPGCSLLAPGGTIYAALGESLELVGVPLSPDITRFDYFVGPRSMGTAAAGLASARVLGLTSGDQELGVRCYDAGGRLRGESRRPVTLNGDQGTKVP